MRTSPLDSFVFSPLQGQTSLHFFHLPYNDSTNMTQGILHCTASCRNIRIQLNAGSLALHEALTDYRPPGQWVFLFKIRRVYINNDSGQFI